MSEESTSAELLPKYEKAGEILRRVRAELIKLVTKGARAIDVAERIETRIKELGARPAFPVNICIGDVAAHYTPEPGEETSLPDDRIVKVDIGVHVDGCIADAATSFYFGEDDEKKRMIEVAREAVMKAISMIRPGVDLSEVGAAIEDVVKDSGFKVVRNLRGHRLEPWIVHGEKEVPVVSGEERVVAEEGEVYAIEVFVTNGEGFAKATDEIRIFSIPKDIPARVPLHARVARETFRLIRRDFRTLPFCLRWITKYKVAGRELGPSARLVLMSLLDHGLLVVYPVLRERGGGEVAQHEETVIVTKEGAKVITLLRETAAPARPSG